MRFFGLYAGLLAIGAIHAINADSEPRISLTINARFRQLEISWANLNDYVNGAILVITDVDPTSITNLQQLYAHLVYQQNLTEASGWSTTHIVFDYEAAVITVNTTCYGYWATVLAPESLSIIVQTCIRAYPRWMNEMAAHINPLKIRELFLVGTHDAGAYRKPFNPQKQENRITKYTLTQDEDITSQLMHGVRYLDIRIANYFVDRPGVPQYWVNHGVVIIQPLIGVLRQVREFVRATHEIVIFDVHEFPVGFKQLENHRKLVYYLQTQLGNWLVSPKITWNATIAEIRRDGGNIILSYNKPEIVAEFGDTTLFPSVQHRWANVQSVQQLKKYLSPENIDYTFYERPISDMAEMTPTSRDLLSDRLGGLRRMADETNREVSSWYIGEWSKTVNIVSVDFFRGTTLMELSLRVNANRNAV